MPRNLFHALASALSSLPLCWTPLHPTKSTDVSIPASRLSALAAFSPLSSDGGMVSSPYEPCLSFKSFFLDSLLTVDLFPIITTL